MTSVAAGVVGAFSAVRRSALRSATSFSSRSTRSSSALICSVWSDAVELCAWTTHAANNRAGMINSARRILFPPVVNRTLVSVFSANESGWDSGLTTVWGIRFTGFACSGRAGRDCTRSLLACLPFLFLLPRWDFLPPGLVMGKE